MVGVISKKVTAEGAWKMEWKTSEIYSASPKSIIKKKKEKIR